MEHVCKCSAFMSVTWKFRNVPFTELYTVLKNWESVNYFHRYMAECITYFQFCI